MKSLSGATPFPSLFSADGSRSVPDGSASSPQQVVLAHEEDIQVYDGSRSYNEPSAGSGLAHRTAASASTTGKTKFVTAGSADVTAAPSSGSLTGRAGPSSYNRNNATGPNTINPDLHKKDLVVLAVDQDLDLVQRSVINNTNNKPEIPSRAPLHAASMVSSPTASDVASSPAISVASSELLNCSLTLDGAFRRQIISEQEQNLSSQLPPGRRMYGGGPPGSTTIAGTNLIASGVADHQHHYNLSAGSSSVGSGMNFVATNAGAGASPKVFRSVALPVVSETDPTMLTRRPVSSSSGLTTSIPKKVLYHAYKHKQKLQREGATFHQQHSTPSSPEIAQHGVTLPAGAMAQQHSTSSFGGPHAVTTFDPSRQYPSRTGAGAYTLVPASSASITHADYFSTEISTAAPSYEPHRDVDVAGVFSPNEYRKRQQILQVLQRHMDTVPPELISDLVRLT
ncbi:unnamed protein product [Amoebophrya sp. A120]|nr:unnamed protein product [Amoebophrya sp. A120]|eukprot:GSA120T00002499001.1